MAKKQDTTLEEAIQVILESDGENPFRAMLEFMAQQVLEYEMGEHVGAAPYERTRERVGYRNGCKTRTLTTAVGDLILLVPQDRDGTFETSIFERYQRSDKALVLAMMEMYVQGVSTRKVAAITEKLCGRTFSSQLVSNLCKGLDEMADDWRNRPLEGDYPFLLVDARYEKVRRCGRIISQGVLIVTGINSKGRREILAVEMADTENATTWSDLLRDLKRRGLTGVLMVTSDDHEGIKAAVNRYFQGASWQRCQFHFIRNMLALAGKGEKKELHADLRSMFDAPDIETANRRKGEIMEKWMGRRPAVSEKIDDEIEDTLACLHLPQALRKRTRTSNCPERLNQEIKRRTRVVRIFPNEASALRLISSVCMEISDEWTTGKRYLDVDLLKEWKRKNDEQGEGELALLAASKAGGDR